MKILFIGNSFTGRNDLPRLLSEIAASAPKLKTVVTDRVLANGASLRLHWNAGLAIEKIAQGRFDFVVLQEQSTLPIKNAHRFHENVRLFDQLIKSHGARTVLFQTWARQHVPENQSTLSQTTETIAAETGALTVPVGDVWQTVMQAEPQLSLYDKDGSHPSPLGSYLAACVFSAVLVGRSPVGLVVPESLNVSPQQAAILQKAAQAATSKSK